MITQSPMDDYKVNYKVGIVQVRIPGKKNAKQLFLLGGWLVFWFLVLSLIFTIFSSVAKGAYHDGKFDFLTIPMFFFLTFGLFFWGMAGVFAGYAFLWQIGGLETLEISHDFIRVRKTIFGIGRTKEYKKDQIKSISIVQPLSTPVAFTKFRSTQFQVEITGPVMVQSAGRKIEYLGLGLEREQAEKVRAIIKLQLFPDRI